MRLVVALENFELDISLTCRARPQTDLLPEMDARAVSANYPVRIEWAEFRGGRLLPQGASLAHGGGHKLISDVQPWMGAEKRRYVIVKVAA
jgi:hypothetical protein